MCFEKEVREYLLFFLNGLRTFGRDIAQLG